MRYLEIKLTMNLYLLFLCRWVNCYQWGTLFFSIRTLHSSEYRSRKKSIELWKNFLYKLKSIKFCSAFCSVNNDLDKQIIHVLVSLTSVEFFMHVKNHNCSLPFLWNRVQLNAGLKLLCISLNQQAAQWGGPKVFLLWKCTGESM